MHVLSSPNTLLLPLSHHCTTCSYHSLHAEIWFWMIIWLIV